MSGGGGETGATGIQEMVVAGRGGCGEDADSGLGGGTYEGGVGD